DGYTKLLGGLFVIASTLGLGLLKESAAVETAIFGAACGVLGLLWAFLWWRGTCRAALAVGMVDALAKDLNLIPLEGSPVKETVKEVVKEAAAVLPETAPAEGSLREGAA